MNKIKKKIQEVWSFQLTYSRKTAIAMCSIIVLLYSVWGLLLEILSPEFYDGLKIRFFTVFPFAILIYFNAEKYLPWLSNRLVLLLMSVAVNLNLQYLVVQNNYHEVYLVSLIVVIGLSLGAFNSLSHLLIFSISSFYWVLWNYNHNGFIEGRILFWCGMLVTTIFGGFGYFIPRMSLLMDRKNNLSKLQEQYEELVKTQSKLLKQESQIINTSRLTALGEMAGGVAHEINNPLAAIYGNTTQLIDTINEDTLEKEILLTKLTKIKILTERITKIVKSLRSFSRSAESDPTKTVLLKNIFDEVLDLCWEKLKAKNIELKIQTIPEVYLQCRSTQIVQVLIHFIFNSYDAIQEQTGKWIKIEFRNCTDSSLQIAITDSGTGIPEQIREKVFQPFFTTKEVGKGTGLGLSISKGIIEDHGGKVFIDEQALNTCFIIELPNMSAIKKDSK